MTLFQTPATSLTYHVASGTLLFNYSTSQLSGTFDQAYQLALETMLRHDVDKLLLDLRHHLPPTHDAALLVAPLVRTFSAPRPRPVLVAAVLSEGQYHNLVGNYTPGNGGAGVPSQVEFNYFTSRHDAATWLQDN